MPCFGRRRSKKSSMHQHAVSSPSYKKGCCSFLLIQPRKSAAIFSRKYTVCGAWKWCKHFVRLGLERRGKEKSKGEKGRYNRGCMWQECKYNSPPGLVCACVSLYHSACVCVCQGPSELQSFLQSHRSEEWRENTKYTLIHKSTSPPSPSVPPGKVILSSKTFSSLLLLFLSAWSFTL